MKQRQKNNAALVVTAANDAMGIPTRMEVEALKKSWLNDPCWDLHTTEGFEYYRDELRTFETKWIRNWEEQYEKENKERLEKKAAQIGTDNFELVEYLLYLETKIKKLEQSLQRQRSFS